MPGPFPGMDPYLEDPYYWPDFHSTFITFAKAAIADLLPPGFIALSEARVYIGSSRTDTRADVAVFAVAPARRPVESGAVAVATSRGAEATVVEPEIVRSIDYREPYLQIWDRRGGERRVVTVIELLSPTNKMPCHAGHRAYQDKRDEFLANEINLLEIDLLRAGEHTVLADREDVRVYGPYDYLLSLLVATEPRERRVWRLALRNALPTVALPLTEDVDPVAVNLQAVMDRCYEASHYVDVLEYEKAPVPPLSAEDDAWADALLREKGLRK